VKLGAAAIGEETIEQRAAALDVARQNVATAEQSIQQTRALLELPPDHDNPGSVPPDVLENFAALKYTLSSADQSLAQLGLPLLSSHTLSALEEKLRDLAIETAVNSDPAVQAAKARVTQALAALGGPNFDEKNPYNQPEVAKAQKELEDAQLQLSYANVTAPLSGFISNRTVNTGAHVAPGQALLAIRPLQDVWVDANFKETQLNDLRIGQPVDIHVDAYPNKTFHGRVAGFSAGTGAVMSLLPPENATGNFVKVVQRLPVRIDLTAPLSHETPLFAGLSVVPEVDIKASPTGPDAGQRLQGAAAAAE
jgi:membrane fusion protein (multidrug efflux system)